MDKIQDYLTENFNKDIAYYITCAIVIFLDLFFIGLFAYVFDNIIFSIVAFIVIDVIRAYSYGFHEDKTYKCITFTVILFTIFGYISKRCPLWVSFLLCLFCIRDIYLKSPLELNYKEKTKEWHRIKLRKSLFLFMIICLFLLYFNKLFLVNCILQSIIMTDLLLFKNID